jgi:hypothetical protein
MGTAAATAAGFVRPVAGLATQVGRQPPLDRVSIMSLNFQNILRVPDTDPSPERNLALFDLPEMLADTYGVHKIEFQHYHLESTEESYLRELRSRLDQVGSTAEQFNLEFGQMNISAPRKRDRLLAIDLTKRFVDHAVILGVKRLMINQGQLTTLNKDVAIETLTLMSDYAKSKNVIISVETRGGGRPDEDEPPVPGLPTTSRETWDLLAEVIQRSGATSNVDVGGARAANQEELHDCLRLMFPFTANSLHARVSDNWDMATAARFLETDLGYEGLYTIETRGHEATKEVTDVVTSTLSSL